MSDTCVFIESRNIMPGWGCHVCRTYNGLQRQECKYCGHQRCHFVIPEHVKQCPACGWGWTGELPTRNLEGKSFNGHCPNCGHDIEKGLKN